MIDTAEPREPALETPPSNPKPDPPIPKPEPEPEPKPEKNDGS